MAEHAAARTRLYVLVLTIFWALIYGPGLFVPGLMDDVDSSFPEVAREMLVTGDYVTPRMNGVRYLEKPPLHYWLIAASYRLFGVAEWSARLPLALGTLATILAVFSLGRRAYGAEGGLLAGLALATAVGSWLFTRINLHDAYLGLWMTLGMAFFLRGVEEGAPSRLAAWGLAATTGLAVMTKALIGLVFPAGTILLYLLLTGNLRHLLRMRLLSSAAVFLAVAAPWHLLVSLQNGPAGGSRGFAWFYFLNEHLYRYLDKRIPRDYDKVPLSLFLLMTVIWLLPWSAFLPQAVTGVARRWRGFRGRLDERGRASLLFLCWAVWIVFFFSFSTRQEYYHLPVLPALALLVGGWMAEEARAPADSQQRRAGVRSAVALVVIGALAFAVAAYFGLTASTPAPGMDISSLLTKNPEHYALSLGHLFDLTAAVMGAFRWPLLITGCALLAGTAAHWRLRRRGQGLPGALALAAAMAVVLMCAQWALVIFSPVISSKALAEAVRRELRPGEVVMIAGHYEQGSSLNFYLQQPVHVLNGKKDNLWFGSTYPDAPAIFEDDASLLRLWQGSTRVYLWAEEGRVPEYLPRESRHVVARSGGKIIVSNQPSAIGRQ